MAQHHPLRISRAPRGVENVGEGRGRNGVPFSGAAFDLNFAALQTSPGAIAAGSNNVLAIHGLNATIGSSDMLISPRLVLASGTSADNAGIPGPQSGSPQIDFGAIFSQLAAHDFEGWAVVEWECCLKHPEDGAREGAQFVRDHIIRVTEKAFDDFAGGGADDERNRRVLGIGGEGT